MAAFIFANRPPPVFCVAQHRVSASLMRDTHTPLLSNNSALSSPLPRDGVPCVRFVFQQRVSLSPFPPPWLPQAGKDKKKKKQPKALTAEGGCRKEPAAKIRDNH